MRRWPRCRRRAPRLDSTLATLNATLPQARPEGAAGTAGHDDAPAGNAADRLASLTGTHGFADDADPARRRHDGQAGLTDSMLYADLRKTLEAMTDLLNEIAKNPGKIGITVQDSLRSGVMSNIHEHIRGILVELGEDPERQGLQKTPERVEKSLQFLTQGYEQDAAEVIGDALFQECAQQHGAGARHRVLLALRAPHAAVLRQGARRLHSQRQDRRAVARWRASSMCSRGACRCRSG